MLIGAIGLLYDKNWSRIVLKIYSWILIFLIPILGTALGIYSLLIFRKENLLLAEPQNS
jgi:hypothetical protein